MNPEQELKLDRVLELSIKNDIRLDAHERDIQDNRDSIKDLEAYKNKSVGIAAFLSFLFAAIGAGILSLFKH